MSTMINTENTISKNEHKYRYWHIDRTEWNEKEKLKEKGGFPLPHLVCRHTEIGLEPLKAKPVSYQEIIKLNKLEKEDHKAYEAYIIKLF